jgi:type IV secretion system protein VirD4
MTSRSTPNYHLTADYDKKNWFDIEKYLDHELKLRANDRYQVVEVTDMRKQRK